MNVTNVLFEAGMAFGTHPDRTLLIEVGEVKNFSDVAGRHVVRLSNSANRRNEIAERLRTAKCDVSTSGSDWINIGNFNAVRDKQTNSFGYPEMDLTAFDEAYKRFTNQLSYGIGRYNGYTSNLDPANKKYTEVGVWERINEVKSARLQLLSVCGKNIRIILLEAGTEWLNDIHNFGKTAPSLMEKLSEVAYKDRSLKRVTRNT